MKKLLFIGLLFMGCLDNPVSATEPNFGITDCDDVDGELCVEEAIVTNEVIVIDISVRDCDWWEFWCD